MKTYQLLDAVKFVESGPHAEPLHVDKLGRVLLYALRPGQAVREHNAPHSPVTFVVLKGRGMFAGGDGREHELGPDALVVLNPGENHAVRALDEDLVFVALLHGSPWSE
jgi:quercetin dioxygenase-like cupin family protein